MNELRAREKSFDEKKERKGKERLISSVAGIDVAIYCLLFMNIIIDCNIYIIHIHSNPSEKLKEQRNCSNQRGSSEHFFRYEYEYGAVNILYIEKSWSKRLYGRYLVCMRTPTYVLRSKRNSDAQACNECFWCYAYSAYLFLNASICIIYILYI